MKAVRLTEWESPPILDDVEIPEPGPGEVLLKVAGAGLCHSDLHLMEWPEGVVPYDLPFTLGHENAGWVAKTGAGVANFDEGDAVLVYGPWGCGTCWTCAQGKENICEHAAERRGHGGGLGRDGGLAEYVLVPSERLLVPIGDLDPVMAAPLTDAGLTPYHVIKAALPYLLPGTTVVVIGVGGLGHVAVQMLRALSVSRIVAVDTRAEALELATREGADVAIGVSDDTAKDILAETPGGRGAAVVLDFVGVDDTMELAGAVAAVGSHVVIVGIGGGSYPMRFGGSPLEATVTIPNWGSRSELLEVVAFARAGHLTVEVERIGLDEVVATYDRLHRGDVVGRAVAVPA
jgi:propanol-preferring alcohol dehydrogenase